MVITLDDSQNDRAPTLSTRRHMSLMGHVLCRECKLKLTLGKLKYDSEGNAIGFWGPSHDPEKRAQVLGHFLAAHLTHEVIVLGERLYDMDDLCEYDALRELQPDCKWAREHEPVLVGGVTFYRTPCEPVSDRLRRERGELEN
jgi:hypothetical protein